MIGTNAFQIFAFVPVATPAAVVFTLAIAVSPTGARMYPTTTKNMVMAIARPARSPTALS